MKKTLIIIVLAQFFCTSLWFAGNAVMADLIKNLHANPDFLAQITSAVQLGFICGTLIFAILAISDRFSPSKVFFISATLAAISNLGLSLEGIHAITLLIFRCSTGFFLAGIYPVGMKIASDYFREGLGKSLGFLVGALVLGTAFSHFLKSISLNLPWVDVIYFTSFLAFSGGLILLFFVPDGPHRKAAQQLKWSAFFVAFKHPDFKAAALGYFGHMWELYTFWAFVPMMLAYFVKMHPQQNFSVPFWSFLIIASGAFSCVFGGLISAQFGTKKVAATALALSGFCCLLSPLIFQSSSFFLLITFLLFWGMMVVADSPLFSTLVAQNAPPETRGTALTIVNCIGFAITIISIQCLQYFSHIIDYQWLFLLLVIGPLLGLLALFKKISLNFK